MLDSLIVCKILAQVLSDFYREGAELQQVTAGIIERRAGAHGERIHNLKNFSTCREGWRCARLAAGRVLSETLPTGIDPGVGLSAKNFAR